MEGTQTLDSGSGCRAQVSVARKLQRSTLTAAFLLLRYRCTRAAMLREGIPGPRLSPLPRRARYRLKLRVVDAAFQRVWRTRRLTAAVERWEAQAAVRHQQRGVMAETARRWARRRRMRAVVASWLVAIEARLRKKRLTLHCVSLWASGTSVAPAAALAFPLALLADIPPAWLADIAAPRPLWPRHYGCECASSGGNGRGLPSGAPTLLGCGQIMCDIGI